MAPGAERGPAGLVPDPHRLRRVHVVNVRLDRSGTYVVACSDGVDLTWDEWCAWGCADMRRSDAEGRGGPRGEGAGDGEG